MLAGETPRDLTLDDAPRCCASRPSSASRRSSSARRRPRGAARARCRCSAPTADLLRRPQHGDGAGPVPAARRARARHAGVRDRQQGAQRAVPARRRRSANRCASATGASASSACSATQGESLGFNTDEIVIVPVSTRAGAVQHRVAVPHPGRGARPRADRRARSDDRRDDHEAAPRGRGGRHRHHAGRGARHLRPHLHGADADGGRHRRHQPGGGRHPDHERDADRGDPAHGGDRPAEGARRARPADPALFLTEAMLLSLGGAARRAGRRPAGAQLVIARIYPIAAGRRTGLGRGARGR